MDERYEGNLASDGAGILTGLGLLIVAFYVIPGARSVPPLFRATAGILLSFVNLMVWTRSSRVLPSTPRRAMRATAVIVGLIAVNVALDAAFSGCCGSKSLPEALYSSAGGLIDCGAILIAVFVGVPTLVRSMIFHSGWGREW